MLCIRCSTERNIVGCLNNTEPKVVGYLNNTERNVVSMSLYGSAEKYCVGILRNAELIKTNLPGWSLRVYVETNTTNHYPKVPAHTLDSLKEMGKI